jgi:hypothetical protein
MLRRAHSLLSLLVLASTLSGVGSQEGAPKSTDRALAPFSVFLGDWDCAGTFANSGKAIEARLSFKRDLDGRWILFRHDDKPPFSYHALSEWGWDAARMEFVMLVEDSTGGLRSFRSTGLRERKIIWDGGAFQSAKPDQRFIFEVIDSDHFRVSYFRQTDGNWRLVDSSTCSTSVR